MRPVVVASVVVLAGLSTACGPKELPPPAAPAPALAGEAEMPEVGPAPGSGRVVLEAAGGEKARVVEVSGEATAYGYRYTTTIVETRPVCRTPCVVDLTYGSHQLVFQSMNDEARTSDVEVDVGAHPKAVLHAIGERRQNTGAAIGGGLATA